MARVYNVVRDKEDPRDYKFEVEMINQFSLPSIADLRNLCPSVYDQGEQGSCTANAGVAARVMLLGRVTLLLSRAFLYYQARKLEGTTREDSGATLRDLCKAVYSYGICEEKYMPYDDKVYTKAPSFSALINAMKYKIKSYTRLNSLASIKTSLGQNRKPVIIGMEVYESMETEEVANTGILPMPQNTEQLLGGHAVLVVGYVDNIPTVENPSRGYLIVRNSWGEIWGDNGYFYMPYEYVENYTFDYWIFNN